MFGFLRENFPKALSSSFVLVEDGVDAADQGEVELVFFNEVVGGEGGVFSFDDGANFFLGFVFGETLAEEESEAVIAAEVGDAGDDEIADTGETKAGGFLCPFGARKGAHLLEATGDQKSPGIEAIT